MGEVLDVHREARKRHSLSDYLYPLLSLLLLNVSLSTLKLIFGFLGQSTALRSVGWNNAADFIYTILLGVGLWISTRPPDESHPEGHDRFESLVSVGVGFVICATGGYVLWDSYHAFMTPRTIQVGLWGLTVLGVSMAGKGLISWYLYHEGNRLSSTALRAIGMDQAGDILADFTVVVAVFSSYSGWNIIDPIVAFGVGLFILRIAWETLQESVHQLTGRAPDDELIASVQEKIHEMEDLKLTSHIRAHHVGPLLHLSLTVKASGTLPLRRVHDLEEELRERLLSLDRVSRVFIHIEPFEADSPN